MRPALLLALGGGILLAGAAAVADPGADPGAGRTVASMCRTCHGIDGFATIPTAPHIGGEPRAYLQAQLLAFKTGRRTHNIMNVVAAGLSTQQIADVSAWYSAHQVRATLPPGANPNDAPQPCIACHGADGIARVPDAPNLAGEANVYISTQLNAFRRGPRDHAIMAQVAGALTPAEIRAIADWYAAITLEITPPAP
ncbi:MAG: cytochrome c4 [Rhodobacteraceae bacterium]|nr:cytochrome c4 [Paracoccaceae bacterium]